MKFEKRLRAAFSVILAAVNAVVITYLKEFIPVADTLKLLLVLLALPILVLILNPKSKFSVTASTVAMVIILIFGVVYSIYWRRPLGIVMALSAGLPLIYFILRNNEFRKERLLTKIVVSLLLIGVTLNIGLVLSRFVSVESFSTINATASMWDCSLEVFSAELCTDSETEGQKVQLIYDWIKDNIEYDYGKHCIYQYFDPESTFQTKSGICFDYANLFAAMCRSQSIPCIVLDGYDKNYHNLRHTWNRVYFDGCWWNVDVTYDSTHKERTSYGFVNMDAYSSPDDACVITRIY